MSRVARCWVLTSPHPRVLLPVGGSHVSGEGELPCHRSRAVQGAELDGPWMVRAAVRLPLGPQPSKAVVYGARWIGAIHLRWLCQMGLRSATPYLGPPLPSWAAFRARAPGDVVVGTRKVCSVGEVFGRREVLLVASTLLHPPPWSRLGAALGRSDRDVAELGHGALAASMLLGRQVDAAAWAAHLRRLLHLSLGIRELQEAD